MEARLMLEKPAAGTRVASADCRAALRDTRHAEKSGAAAAYSHHGHHGHHGPVLYKFLLDGGAAAAAAAALHGGTPKGNRLHDGEKPGLVDQRDAGCPGTLKRASPPHCAGASGPVPAAFMHLDIRSPERAGELQAAPADRQPLPSSHIPVPRNRKPSGHADKEVMAATVLTSLSTSPLVLNPSSAPTVPEPASRAWKEMLSASYSSSTSGNWSWDASDQSVPSTPSPPLSNDNNKNFLLSPPGDDVGEDTAETTHFMFEDPIPRKRKNSMKVMFKCLWKNCEKVLSTSSGIQRHIRTLHLGRSSDSDYSDGEEDFYYSEIEVNMDSLSEGLSSLTPTSPTTAGPPPAFPPPPPPPPLADAPHSEHIRLHGWPSHAPSPLSQSAPSTLCHIRTDHAYQATAPVSVPAGPELAGLGSGNGSGPGAATGSGMSVSWQPPPAIFKGALGPVTHVRTISIAEKRQPAASINTTVNKSHALITPNAKSTAGNRKPRGEAKKCRKVYGMEKRDMWCTACRWKKACQRFTD